MRHPTVQLLRLDTCQSEQPLARHTSRYRVLVAVVRRGLAYVLLPLIGCRVICPQLIGQLRTGRCFLKTTVYMRQRLLKKHVCQIGHRSCLTALDALPAAKDPYDVIDCGCGVPGPALLATWKLP
jgi:hypothetical protein